MFDKILVRHAYDQAIIYAARLSAYASAKIPKYSSEISEKQDALAKDDLIHFAYHTRRVLALTDTRNKFSSICIPIKPAIGKSFNFEGILNTIIHNEFLEVFRTECESKIHFAKNNDEAMSILLTYGKTVDTKQIPTGVAVKSDNTHLIKLELGEFLEIFEKSILPTIIDVCSENGLYVELDLE